MLALEGGGKIGMCHNTHYFSVRNNPLVFKFISLKMILSERGREQ